MDELSSKTKSHTRQTPNQYCQVDGESYERWIRYEIRIGASAADDVADENKNLGTHNQLPETNTLNHCDAMNT